MEACREQGASALLSVVRRAKGRDQTGEGEGDGWRRVQDVRLKGLNSSPAPHPLPLNTHTVAIRVWSRMKLLV